MQKGIVIGIVAAACLMIGCTGNKAQMLQLLEELEATNRAGEQLLNDSLAEELVDYFERHGSSNERMRSRYMLGRTYYFMGELPRALEIYNEAADCADTTSADCDYKVLSRIHAQKAVIFNMQVQPRSQLQEFRLAEYYAWKGKDTLQAIECYAQQANAYEFLKINDSVNIITENASLLFEKVGKVDRASQILGLEISSLLDMGELEKARSVINKYESSSAFDSLGNIMQGLEIFYYVKGKYYLLIGKTDSAEYFFRKELKLGKDLNNQIAGCKGLQQIYEQKKYSDSIAKYANHGYILNDSAYSLSEMQNIQQFQASYNYNHKKQLAEQKAREAERAWLILALVICGIFIILLLFSKKYYLFKKAALDYRLKNAEITSRLRKMAKSNPPILPNLEDWKQLRALVEREIPDFSEIVNAKDHPLSDLEYDVCLMVRVHLMPIEIARLKKCTPSYVSNIRKNLLKRIFGKDGSSEDFDDEIGKIGY
jgi:hypothetical protein